MNANFCARLDVMSIRETIFMAANRISPGETLSRVSFSKSLLDAMRSGRSAGSAKTMAELRAACAHVLQRPITIEELFDFDVLSKPAAPSASMES